MEFLILGPVEAREQGCPVELRGEKRRATLAILLLNAGRVVGVDRLISHLWGEDPPPTAATAVHGHVSALRKILGADRISTEPPGYVLHLQPGELDLERFEDLCRQARATMDAGDAEAAAGKLRAALALWRGEPLANIGPVLFAGAEAARLEGMRLTALEDRIDADLATGRARELVGELEALVAREPLRERLWGQLMSALYQAGRQAEALDAYRRARRHLVGELGIEPGPTLRDLERRILEQDPELAPRTPRPAPTARRAARRRWYVAVATAAAVAGVLVAASGGGSDVTVPSSGVAVVDADSGKLVGAVALESEPGPVVAGPGGVWAISPASSTLTQIDPGTRRILATRGMGGTLDNVAAASSGIWVARRCAAGGDTTRVGHAFSPHDGGTAMDTEIAVERLPGPVLQVPTGEHCGFTALGNTVWAAVNFPAGLARVQVDRETLGLNTVWRVPLPSAPISLAPADGAVWAVDSEAGLVRRIAADGRVAAQVSVGHDPVAIAAGGGALWVANHGDDSVSRIDARRNVVTKAITVGDQPVAVAVGEGAVWVANRGDATVSKIDLRTDRVLARIDVTRAPAGVAVANGAVWISVGGDDAGA